jgi:hypothetical protein
MHPHLSGMNIDTLGVAVTCLGPNLVDVRRRDDDCFQMGESPFQLLEHTPRATVEHRVRL